MADVLNADIERLGLKGKAWLTPYFTDMPMVMNAIDCLVHSQIGTEAFGLVVCEAYACGKPVIASALDGIPDSLAAGNYGQLVKPESKVDELAVAMRDWARPARAYGSRARDADMRRWMRSFSMRAYGERHARNSTRG